MVNLGASKRFILFLAFAALIIFEASNAAADDDVFLKQTTDRTSVYVGEQVVNTFELYTRVPLVNPQFMDLAYDGFWQESFSEDKHSAAEVRGRYYNVIKIRRALFALTPGEKTLPERQIKASTVVMPELPSLDDLDPFDQQFMEHFFGQEQYREKIFSSNSLSLEVKPLPAPSAALPTWPGSQGLVGSTTVKASSSSSSVRMGEPKVITIDVASIGNLSKLQAPLIADNPSYRVYTERPRTLNQEANGRLVSRRIFKVSVVPLVSGDISLPPLKLAYFDPSSKDYHIIETSISTFKALENPAASALVATQAANPRSIDDINTPAVPTAENKITPQPQATPSNVLEEPDLGSISTASLTLIASSIALILTSLILVKAKLRLRRQLQNELKHIRKCSNLNQLIEFISDYITKELNLTSTPKTTDALRFAISNSNLKPELVHQLNTIINQINLAQYQFELAESDFDRLREDSQLALSALKRRRA